MRSIGGIGAILIAVHLAGCAYYQESSERRILAVGIDAYEYVADLGACVSDARAMADAVSADTKTVIAGEDDAHPVTKSDVLGAIARAAGEAPSGGYGLFVFDYSGHGDAAKGGILAMGDVTIAMDEDAVITSGELLSAVAAVPAAVRVVILDSCNSGLFVDTGADVSTQIGDGDYSLTELIAEAASRYDEGAQGDIVVMSAAGAEELSQESSTIDHGYFTMGLLRSADRGDANGDGLVTLTEAFAYASEYVAETFNSRYPYAAYYPRVSGSALDVVLFKANENR